MRISISKACLGFALTCIAPKCMNAWLSLVAVASLLKTPIWRESC